jgi:alkaline phosphatase
VSVLKTFSRASQIGHPASLVPRQPAPRTPKSDSGGSALRFPSKTSIALMGSIAAIGAAGAAIATGTDQDRTQAAKQAIKGGTAKNVILLIGDGMGDSEITIARNYARGAAGRLAMDSLPLTGAYTTYALQESDPSKPDYVTDSAASGTGWATGYKTSNGRISTTAGTDLDVKTILELAQQRGMRTGNVSTAELTDATPAVLAAHVRDRGCQGPTNMGGCPQDLKAVGGAGSIAEQLVDHHVDVILGGGKGRFDQTIPSGADAGKTVVQSAQRQGYDVVTDADGLAASQPFDRVLGLFSAGTMSLEWSGQPATAAGTGPQTCTTGQRPASEPSLAAMTSKAIDLLTRKVKGDKRKGFFLQVEGASIDKQDHAANPCGQIGETIAFDRAIQVALDFAKRNPDTLIVVTADHGHSSQIVPVGSHPLGLTSILTTADGAQMKVAYGTAASGGSQEHTGTQVRIAAQGPQAANVLGVTDQTDLFRTLKRAIGA